MHESAENMPPGLRRKLVGLCGMVVAVWAANFGLSLLTYILPPAAMTRPKALFLSGHPAISIFGLLLLILFFSFALKGQRWAHVLLCVTGIASVTIYPVAMVAAYAMRKHLPGLDVTQVLCTHVTAATSGVLMLVVLLAKDTRRYFADGVAPPHWQDRGPRQMDPLVVAAALCQLCIVLFVGALQLRKSDLNGSLQLGFDIQYRFSSDWVYLVTALAVASGLLVIATLPMKRWLRGVLLGVLVVASILISMATPFLFKSVYSLDHFDKIPWKAQYMVHHLRQLAWYAIVAALAYRVRHRVSIPALLFLLIGAGAVILFTWVEPALVGKYWRPPAGYGTRRLLVTCWALLSALVLIPGGWTRWLAGLWLVFGWLLLIGTSWMFLRYFLDKATVTTSAWIALGSWWAVQRAAETVLTALVGLRILESFDKDPKQI